MSQMEIDDSGLNHDHTGHDKQPRIKWIKEQLKQIEDGKQG